MQIFKYLALLSLLSASAQAHVAFSELAVPLTLFIMLFIAIFALFLHLKQLHKSERLSQLLFTNAPIPMFVINSKERVLRFNKQLQHLLNINPDTLLGALWYEQLLSRDTIESIRQKLHTNNTHSFSFNSPYTLTDGTLIQLEFTAQKLPYQLTLFSCEVSK